MPLPSRAEVLAFMARHEPLEQTLSHFPGVTREHLRALLREAALLMRAEEAQVPEADPAPSAAPEVPPSPREAAKSQEAAPGPQDLARPAPRARRLRLYSDGAARGNPGPAGAGAVLVKGDGAVVARLGKFLGEQTNNVAEYQGLILGLEAALKLGADEIEIRADSELMVRQILGTYRVKNPGLKPLYGRARELLRRFAKVDIAHVPREENREADEMSNRAIDERL
jgi:ribonuclease HI